MNTGQYISGAGHLALIGWVLFGSGFAPAPEPFEVHEVAVISGEEFDAMMAAQQAPQSVTEVASPAPPDAQITPVEVSPPQDVPPETVPPEVAETPPPDVVPDVVEPVAPTPEVAETAPVMSRPSEEVAALVPEVRDSPAPQDAPRVAPEPVAKPEPDVKVDEVVREEAKPEEPAEQPRDEEKATAPEEATTEIVTEATEKPSAAPTASVRPKSRPAPKPAEKPVETAAADKPAAKDPVKEALEQAMAGGNVRPAAAPQGPPMTGGEKDALRLAVSACWNVGSLSSEALRTTVVIAMEMGKDGKPVSGSIRMVSSAGGAGEAAKQAYESARRAIIRCGANGYNLPVEKYDHWREIEMTFNPEKMRIK